MAALIEANTNHASSYGADQYTAQLQNVVADHFGADARANPVFNGTGANVIALQAMSSRWAGVICANWAHINTDEGGAPEKVGGLKLLAAPPDFTGKLTPDAIDSLARGFGDEHHAQPEVVSFAQTSELGRVYSIPELRDLCQSAHMHGMKVHMDGARIANAAAALGVTLREVTTDVGVDVLSFGGTKNGLMFGELVVALRPDDSDSLRYLRKTDMQLASKMRFISAQFLALLSDSLWLENASHANAMAKRLEQGLQDAQGIEILLPTDANAIFATVESGRIQEVTDRFGCLVVDEALSAIRIMTSFDTTESDVNDFLSFISS